MQKVSVIVPTYNEQDSIDDCLKSLYEQSYKNMEVVAVDDGSTDTTVDVLSRYCLPEHGCKIWKQKHKGAGAARNFGATKASGEILVFVDADMIFDKDFVKNLIAPIVEKGEVGSFSKEEFLINKDNVWARSWNINRGLPADRMHGQNYPDRQKVFRAIKKEAFEAVGGFDEKAGYSDDWSLAKKLGIEAMAAPGAIFYHKNPDRLKEVFTQSRWMAKRPYKLGFLGYFVALARTFFPVSLILGLSLSIYRKLPAFIIFKLVSDFGQFLGILEYMFIGKVAK